MCILYQNGAQKSIWIIPGFENGYRTLARPRVVFFDFAAAGDSDHMPSSGQKLELHLQVAVLLPDAIEPRHLPWQTKSQRRPSAIT